MKTEDSAKILKALNSMTAIDAAEHLAAQNRHFNEVESVARDHQTFSALMRECLDLSRRAFTLSEALNQQIQRLTDTIRLVPPDEGVRKELLVAADQLKTSSRQLVEKGEQLRAQIDAVRPAIDGVGDLVSLFGVPVKWVCVVCLVLSAWLIYEVRSLNAQVSTLMPSPSIPIDFKYKKGVLLLGARQDADGQPCTGGEGCGRWVVSTKQPAEAPKSK